jgi:peptidoglycan-N-acetylglucosamine deacetylase
LEATAWRAGPALRISAVLHAAAAAGAVARPESWPALLSLVAVNHLVLLGAGLAPRSSLLGPNLTRLPTPSAQRCEVALTFDDGPDPAITPKVLELLGHHGARATFFCVGERAAAHPGLVREIVRNGHCVENHSYRHSTAFGWYGWSRLTREIHQAQDILAEVSGTVPRFFRAPFGMRSPLLDPALARAGLQLVSWTQRGYDAVDGNAERVLVRLTRGLAAGSILLMHDGIATRATLRTPAALTLLPRLLELLSARELRAVTLREACGPAQLLKRQSQT